MACFGWYRHPSFHGRLLAWKPLLAYRICSSAPSEVPLHVQGQVVRPGKGPVAQVALEGPVTCVLAVVAGKLVGARELPAAAVPVAMIRLLACSREE